jgi:hypothetical protein
MFLRDRRFDLDDMPGSYLMWSLVRRARFVLVADQRG